MTPVQARVALSRPLVFGDQQQLEARAVMEEVNQAEKALMKCGHDYERRKKLCACVSSMRSDIVRFALSGLKDRRIGRDAQNSFDEINRCF
jgi:hypothetical protein